MRRDSLIHLLNNYFLTMSNEQLRNAMALLFTQTNPPPQQEMRSLIFF